jgi:hypothetical protein
MTASSRADFHCRASVPFITRWLGEAETTRLSQMSEAQLNAHSLALRALPLVFGPACRMRGD